MKREAFFSLQMVRHHLQRKKSFPDFVMFLTTTCRSAFSPLMASDTEVGPKQTGHTKMRGRKTGGVKYQPNPIN